MWAGFDCLFHIYFSPPSAVLRIWFSGMHAECSVFKANIRERFGLTRVASGLAGEKKPRWFFGAAPPQHQMNMVQMHTTVLLVTPLMQVEWMQIICSTREIFRGCRTWLNTHTDTRLHRNVHAHTHIHTHGLSQERFPAKANITASFPGQHFWCIVLFNPAGEEVRINLLHLSDPCWHRW